MEMYAEKNLGESSDEIAKLALPRPVFTYLRRLPTDDT